MAPCIWQRIRITNQICGHAMELTNLWDVTRERAVETGFPVMCATRMPVCKSTRPQLCGKPDCLLSMRGGRWTCCQCQQVVEDMDTCQNLNDDGDTCLHVLCDDCGYGQ